ncbi:hypothetical protein [Pseudomonas fluorescens]|jgi:hypothetical protein
MKKLLIAISCSVLSMNALAQTPSAISVDKLYPELVGVYTTQEDGVDATAEIDNDGNFSLANYSLVVYASEKSGNSEYVFKTNPYGKSLKSADEGCKGLYVETDGYCMRSLKITRLSEDKFAFEENNKKLIFNKTE